MSITSFQEFEQIYEDIHACRKCAPGVFPSCVRRQTDEAASRSGIVLMGQAPTEHGVRESGVHWVGADRRLRPGGGTFLDEYLRQIGYSVNPEATGYRRPYTTNVLHCWTGPGPKAGRDRKPTRNELENCKPWWLKELELVRPRGIILLGQPAAESFAAICGDQRPFKELLSSQGEEMPFGDLDLIIRRYVVPQPTAPYPRRSEIYNEVFRLVRDALGPE